MSVEPKRTKLWDKLYTDTSSHEKIRMRTRPCKSKSCTEGRFSHWIHITVLRVGQTNDLWHDFVCEKLYTYTSTMWKFAPGNVLVTSYLKIVQKSVFWWKIAHCYVSQLLQLVETRRIRRSNGKLCSKLHTDMGSCVKICTRTWPCESKSGVEARLFTVNTVLRISKTNLLGHCFMCQKLDTEKSS